MDFIKNFKIPDSCKKYDTYWDIALDITSIKETTKQSNITYIKLDQLLEKFNVVDKGTYYCKTEHNYEEHGYKNILVMINGKLISLDIHHSMFMSPFKYLGLNVGKFDEPYYKYLYTYSTCKCKLTDEQIIANNKKMEFDEQHKLQLGYDRVSYNCDFCGERDMEYPHITYCSGCKKYTCTWCKKI